MRAIFRMYDKDGNGALSVNELVGAAKSTKHRIETEQRGKK